MCYMFFVVDWSCLGTFFVCFVYCYRGPRELHVRTHPFPTRRSSDLGSEIPAVVSPRESLQHVTFLPQRGRDLVGGDAGVDEPRSEEHTSELQSLMSISYDVFCLKNKKEADKTYIHTSEIRTSNVNTYVVL